jgi:flagellar assembly factor FliW
VTIKLEFPHGLPAFETEKRFRLTQTPERAPLLFLESEATPGLSFLLLPLAAIDPGYRLALSAEDREIIDAPLAHGNEGNDANLLCLAVLTAAEDSPLTANLLAPIVINLASGRAVQAVRSDRVYSHKYPLLPALLPALHQEEAPCS